MESRPIREELTAYHHSKAFRDCRTMGDIVERHIKFTLDRHIS